MGEQALDLGGKRLQVGEIDEADGAPADLVLIGGADAALGGADAGRCAGGLAERVEFAMQRQDQRGVLGDAQIVRGHCDALLVQLVDLLDQRAAGRPPRRCR